MNRKPAPPIRVTRVPDRRPERLEEQLAALRVRSLVRFLEEQGLGREELRAALAQLCRGQTP